MLSREDYARSKRRKELGLARCSNCKQDKPIFDFEPCPGRRPFNLSSHCNICNNARKSKNKQKWYFTLSKDERKAYNRRHSILKFGLTVSQYDSLLAQQNFVCAICKKPETDVHHATKAVQNLAVDHCHKTKVVRGLLCARCNKGIGCFLENEEYLLSAINYLRKGVANGYPGESEELYQSSKNGASKRADGDV